VNCLICPTCGCSLVRLGIDPVRSLSFLHEGIEYLFCCSGCRDLFIHEPRRYLRETDSLEVCPVCLAEKPKSHTVHVEHAGRVLHFCRCPQCLEEFHRRPAYYIDRLEGRMKYGRIFGDEQPLLRFTVPFLGGAAVCRYLSELRQSGSRNHAEERVRILL
jgi:YHS domain-containing protein